MNNMSSVPVDKPRVNLYWGIGEPVVSSLLAYVIFGQLPTAYIFLSPGKDTES